MPAAFASPLFAFHLSSFVSSSFAHCCISEHRSPTLDMTCCVVLCCVVFCVGVCACWYKQECVLVCETGAMMRALRVLREGGRGRGGGEAKTENRRRRARRGESENPQKQVPQTPNRTGFRGACEEHANISSLAFASYFLGFRRRAFLMLCHHTSFFLLPPPPFLPPSSSSCGKHVPCASKQFRIRLSCALSTTRLRAAPHHVRRSARRAPVQHGKSVKLATNRPRPHLARAHPSLPLRTTRAACTAD